MLDVFVTGLLTLEVVVLLEVVAVVLLEVELVAAWLWDLIFRLWERTSKMMARITVENFIFFLTQI